jgi:hypothetical protein
MRITTHRQNLQILAASLLCFAMLACASLGVPEADTFNKKTVVANGLVESASATVETLYTAGKLSQPDARSFNQRLENAAKAIDIAKQVHQTDPATADARLSAIIAGLNALQSELQARKGETP